MESPTLVHEHSDSRGDIWSLQLPGNREVMLLRSVKGSFRGGHSHSCPETIVVLEGLMRYWKKSRQGREWKYILGGGDRSDNAPGEVHMGEFLEETWLLEVKHARKGEWTQEDYEPYRSRVRSQIVPA